MVTAQLPLLLINLLAYNDFSGQVPYLRYRRQKVKVFWFFSSEKNKSLLFLKKKKQKDFYFRRVVFSDTGLGRKVIANQHLQALARGEQLRNLFFSEERPSPPSANQKTLIFPAEPRIPAMAGKLPLLQNIKVFCFFSSEKKNFPLSFFEALKFSK